MPRFALHPIEHLYEIDPSASPLRAVSLGMAVGIDGVKLIPHVYFNPGRWFSFVGALVAPHLKKQSSYQPRPITQDPVPVYQPGQPQPFRHEPARDLLDRYGATCEFGEVEIQLYDPARSAYTVPHRLFARFATARTGNVYDTALVLGLSFLIHNNSELQATTAGGRFQGTLDLS
jgi:hypothetical protein